MAGYGELCPKHLNGMSQLTRMIFGVLHTGTNREANLEEARNQTDEEKLEKW